MSFYRLGKLLLKSSNLMEVFKLVYILKYKCKMLYISWQYEMNILINLLFSKLKNIYNIENKDPS